MTIELIVEGTRVEFKKELTLKSVPEVLERNKFYKFEIEGYCIFPIGKIILMREKSDSGTTSSPLASIIIHEQNTYMSGGIIHTKGEYLISNIPAKI